MADAVGGYKETHLKHEISIRFCDVCKDDNYEPEAVVFCSDCEQYLCAMCKQYHQKVAATKKHNILGITLRSVRKEKASSEYTNIPKCNKHNDLFLEFYCEEHDSAICKTCKIVDHHKCENFEMITKIAKERSNECTDLVDYFKIIEKSFEQVKTARDTEKAELTAETRKVIVAIKEKRQEFERLEAKALLEVKEMYETESTVIDKKTEVIDHSRPLISAKIKHLENTIKTGTAVEKFLAAKSASKDIRKYTEILHDTILISTRSIHFKENEELSKLDTLGELILTKTGIENEAKLHGDDVLATATPHDTGKSDISAIEIISGGRILLFDNRNTKVKLFSASKAFLSELVLPGKALNMALLNDNEAVVAIHEKGEQSLQKINIGGTTLKLGSFIPTNLPQGLVAKYSDTSLLTLTSDTSLQVINYDGNVEKSTQLDSELFQQPRFIATRVYRDIDLVYIVDRITGVFGFTLDGRTVFHYKEDNYDIYSGLAVDKEGCVYIGCLRKINKTGNIVKLSPVGKKRRSMFYKDRKNRFLPLKCTGNKMFVFTIDEKFSGSITHFYFKWM